ncbi:type IV toxin-antitoxin system AbiEi family antitoxin domain-containing protein [Tsukamurella soli]|uniref:Type IV toxin-antitoxin system AbiEi family antitoxin domain-containing protein n=1 Tax=Tsukamurella soli TaxID=644556 RepID=A0ABP8KJG7_9ACTN
MSAEPQPEPVRLTDVGQTGEIAAILAAQDGIITVGQALAAGSTRGAITARVKRGEWQRVGRAVYLSAEHLFTERARLRAAVAAHRGAAEGAAAAWWHGLTTDLDPVVTVAIPRTARTRAYCVTPVLARRRNLLPADIEVVASLTVTRRPLTLLDCATALSAGEGTRLMDRSLQTGAVTVSGLRAALERNAGLRGMAEARRIVQVCESDSESEAERRFVRLLRAEGITGWVQQVRIGRYRFDIGFPEMGVVIEVDGWAFHRDQRRFQADHDKLNAAVLAGWLPLAFTWHDIDSDPIGTVETVVAALRERRWHAG